MKTYWHEYTITVQKSENEILNLLDENCDFKLELEDYDRWYGFKIAYNAPFRISIKILAPQRIHNKIKKKFGVSNG